MIIAGALVCIAVGIGVYVWYTLQQLQRDISGEEENVSMHVEEYEHTEETAVTGSDSEPEPITVSDDSLTPAQQAILKGFGYTQGTFTITESMITCAESSVGELRLNEIIEGSAPSPLEALKLLPCFKAQ